MTVACYLVAMLYAFGGLFVAFVTAIGIGMAASPSASPGYIGHIQRFGSNKAGQVAILLSIATLWPLHIILATAWRK